MKLLSVLVAVTVLTITHHEGRYFSRGRRWPDADNLVGRRSDMMTLIGLEFHDRFASLQF